MSAVGYLQIRTN